MAKKRTSAVDQVADALRAEILTGRHAPGERLPSEHELAARFGVSRLTVREAVKALAGQGLVRVQQGTGTEVLDYRVTGGMDLVPALLRVRRGENGRLTSHWKSLLADTLEIRRILAGEIAAVATERAIAEDLAALRAERARQAERMGDPKAFAEGDLRFTRLTIACCQNAAMELMFNSVVRIVDAIPEVIEPLLVHPDETLRHYDLVIALFEARDAEAARLTVRESLGALDRALLETIDDGATAASVSPSKKRRAS
ncbi:MAG: FadR family transcriptional regulator [Myxococcales bacterium]|nr:FadR family transcriptional regulator [Myxococcales bacterium]